MGRTQERNSERERGRGELTVKSQGLRIAFCQLRIRRDLILLPAGNKEDLILLPAGNKEDLILLPAGNKEGLNLSGSCE